MTLQEFYQKYPAETMRLSTGKVFPTANTKMSRPMPHWCCSPAALACLICSMQKHPNVVEGLCDAMMTLLVKLEQYAQTVTDSIAFEKL